jgi:hypothetical protein
MNFSYLGIACATGFATATCVTVAPDAKAVQIVVPPTTVSGTNVSSGPGLNVTNLIPDDVLSIQASGAFNLAGGTAFTTNAAGVLLSPSVFGDSPGATRAAWPGSVLPGAPFGALLLGNNTLGFVQVFPADSSNGAGSSTPPTTLTVNTTFGSLFSSLSSSSPYTGTLQWRANDLSPNDNSGLITITNVPTQVPTPALLPGLIGMGAAALRKRKQEVKAEA